MWRPSNDDGLRDAEMMARRLLRGELGSYRGGKVIDDLARVTPAETVRQIFGMIAPYWVPTEDAGRLPALGRELSRRCAVLIGEHIGYLARMYVRRAHLGSLLYELITIAIDNSGNLSCHITAEICNWYRNERQIDLDDDDVINKSPK